LNGSEHKVNDKLIVFIEPIDWQEHSGRIRCFQAGTRAELAYLNWMVRDVKGTTLEIVDFFIHNIENRQLGIGSLLINKFKSIAKQKGIVTVWGNTAFDDYPLHGFYRKHGFVFDSVVKGGGVDFWHDLN